MKPNLAIAPLFSLMCFVASGPAQAQTEAEFVQAFSGEWQVLDDVYSADGQTCRITLGTDTTDAGYGIAAQNCAFELEGLTAWRIVEGQLILVGGENQVAALGGSQRRVSGNSSIGAPIIMDRVGQGQPADAIAAAVAATGCYYLGFTNTCVDEVQLEKPTPSADGRGASITVLVNLNARVEARDEADILGVIPANSCVIVDACTAAVDGVWCRAQFGEERGWLKKLALRQEKWPVVTFVNQCTAPAVQAAE